MRRMQWVLLILGIVIILMMMLWLVNSIYSLYVQISWSAPFLGNLLVGLLAILLLIILAVGLYFLITYFVLPKSARRKKKRRRRPQVKVSENKTEAASQTLQAIRQQIEQIQDEVARQALEQRSQEIEENLKQRNIQVVVFGTGSAGKTSVTNALMGEMVGDRAAPMGTTETFETYTLKLPGIDRKILITDTPGILEPGVAGTQRENMARSLATEADLLLFVIDNDLTASEWEMLQALAAIGKRSLVVFNKTDLYPEEEQTAILNQLKQRLASVVAEKDVIAVAANPRQVTLPDGTQVTPQVEITPLVRRLAAVVRAEGDSLMADNLLLQSARLGEQARAAIDKQRQEQAEKIIERFQWYGAAAIAFMPIPMVDMLGTAAVNAQMVVEIGRVYGCNLDFERGKELAFSLARTLASLGIIKGAWDLMSTTMQVHPGTALVSRAIQGGTAAYLTRIAGKSFIEYFRNDQDWGDGGISEVVQRQFELNRKEEFVRAFVQDAMSQVVDPLQRSAGESQEKKEASGERFSEPTGNDWDNDWRDRWEDDW
jgi:hypothetical protein